MRWTGKPFGRQYYTGSCFGNSKAFLWKKELHCYKNGNLSKPIDKRVRRWYNNKAVERERAKSENFFLPKGIDKREKKWYNRRALKGSERAKVSWKLNNAKKKQNPCKFCINWEINIRVKTQAKELRAIVMKREIVNTGRYLIYKLNKEFDPGSGRTLAARLTHASRTDLKELAFLS